MERRIYEAAVEGSVESLLNLLQEDALVLDRFMVSCYYETPLHIASMLGHVDFVQEILRRKPELAGELDSRRSSPLHLAAAKGHIEIVKKLVSVNPEMCFACDRDGKNPMHIAAIKGHINVLRVLVQARPQAARILMDRSETILHACVLYNQLEAMKLLMQKMNEHEFVNSKDDNGNTILHLAVIDKQLEAVKLLTTCTTIEVNAINANGFTALDLLAQRKLDVKDWKIGELLRFAGATSNLKGDTTTLLTTEPKTTQTHGNNKHSKQVGKKPAEDWLEKKRNALMVVASLIAAMAFQVSLNPPGGVWQDTDDNDKSLPHHKVGYPIMASKNKSSYTVFVASNTTGFMASLSIILLLISGLPCFKRKFFMFILTVIMWVAITAMTLAYLIAFTSLSNPEDSIIFTAAGLIVLGWSVLMAILILDHFLRFIIRMIKFLLKLVKGQKETSNSDSHTV